MRLKVENKREVLVGKLERDRLGWTTFIKIDGTFVKHWIWDALDRFTPGQTVRITIEVLD